MSRPNYKKIVVANDFHIPHQDMDTINLLIRFLNDFQPDTFIINGDFLDCTGVKPFDRALEEATNIQWEFDEGHDILKRFREVIPLADIKYIEGNHEWWLKKYMIRNARELSALRTLTIEAQLRLGELNIEYCPTKKNVSKWVDTYIEMGDLYIGHFDKASIHSAYTAKALLDKYGKSLIQAHVHRGGVHYKSYPDGRNLVAMENFCMCDLSPNYLANANWQQGFSVVYVKDSGRFIAHQIPIVNHKFYWGDREYNLEDPTPELPRKLVIDIL